MSRRIPMYKPRKKHLLIGGGGFFLVYISIFTLPLLFQKTYTAPESVLNATSTKEAFIVNHLDTPEPLKAIYMTSCVAGTRNWREDMKKLIENTELNAVVIDIKDATGRVS